MQTWNLYPYNYWLLWAAIGITILFMLNVFFKVIQLNKAIQTHDPQFKSIQKNLEELNRKSTLLNEKAKKENEAMQKLLPTISLCILMIQNYKLSKEENFKGKIKDSVTKTFNPNALQQPQGSIFHSLLKGQRQ